MSRKITIKLSDDDVDEMLDLLRRLVVAVDRLELIADELCEGDEEDDAD